MANIGISIVIPVFNRASIISRTIDSFLAQTYQDWECIVVDDGSIDNTADVMANYIQRDSRIKYIVNGRTKGAQGARNTGILYAHYDWICIFDSDDYAYPDYLDRMVSQIMGDVDIVTSYLNMKDQRTGKEKVLEWGGDGKILNDLLNGKKYVAFNMAIIRKQKLIDIGLLDEKCPAYQEYDTHIRLSKICNYKSVNVPLSDYYFCGSDTISVNTQRNVAGLRYILHKHHMVWRKRQYEAFLKKTRDVFMQSNGVEKWKMLLFIPELMLFVPMSYIKKKIVG